jgi:hypothetical protein
MVGVEAGSKMEVAKIHGCLPEKDRLFCDCKMICRKGVTKEVSSSKWGSKQCELEWTVYLRSLEIWNLEHY